VALLVKGGNALREELFKRGAVLFDFAEDTEGGRHPDVRAASLREHSDPPALRAAALRMSGDRL
jgi:hypothetical protein